ncbi:MAG: alkaline phosphatase [Saprospiraceae bacterium]|nr:alkaline phosphatase [Saprospiraceae bacterium]
MRAIPLTIGLLLLMACHTSQPAVTVTSTHKRAKNIVLLIGDGMGLTQLTAGLYANNNHLNLERFPVIGLHKAYSANDLITDSAAGATAFACGQKTYNGAIAMGTDSLPLTTILEQAEDRGMATGLVATSTIVHATPAAFIAHNKLRQNYEDIAVDFLKTDIDYFVGGGEKFFNARTLDDRDLVKELRSKGYTVSDFRQNDLGRIVLNKQMKFAYFTADEDPPTASQGRDYLPLAADKGVRYLERRSETGYFMMIEGSQIDWGGHANNTQYIIREMLDFDEAIGRVLNLAEKDGETLVIVTADHECGGFSINYGSKMGKIEGKFTTDGHTGDLVPVFAFGPGAERFGGIYENTAIYDKMVQALGWND